MRKETKMPDKPMIAKLGLVGWYEEGICSGGTYSRGPLTLEGVKAPILIDKSEVLSKSDNQFAEVWSMPSLNLTLPENNVRDLLEGCNGRSGTMEGHLWDNGKVSSCSSVGLSVYIALCKQRGYKVTYRT
jgi:hypothetical protein